MTSWSVDTLGSGPKTTLAVTTYRRSGTAEHAMSSTGFVTWCLEAPAVEFRGTRRECLAWKKARQTGWFKELGSIGLPIGFDLVRAKHRPARRFDQDEWEYANRYVGEQAYLEIDDAVVGGTYADPLPRAEGDPLSWFGE